MNAGRFTVCSAILAMLVAMLSACSPRGLELRMVDDGDVATVGISGVSLGMTREQVRSRLGPPHRVVTFPPIQWDQPGHEWCLTTVLGQARLLLLERWTYLDNEDHPFGVGAFVAFDENGLAAMVGRWRGVDQ